MCTHCTTEVDYDDVMRGLLWIVALGACGSGAGVQISVLDMGVGATTVRIFIGAGGPAARSITVTTASEFDDVQTWFRDPGVDDDTAPMTGGHADFFFEPSGGPTQLPIAIAVGFAANGAPVGAGELVTVDVPGRGYLHYDLPLLASSSLLTWDLGGKTTSDVANKCVRLGSHLVVSPDDQDCDGNIDGTPMECEPDVYMAASRAAVPGEFTCLWPPPQTMTQPTQCFAGGPNCVDGTGQDSTCSKSGYCAPLDLCGQCKGNFRCAETGGGTTGTTPPVITRFECTIAVKHDGTLCGDAVTLPAGTQSDCRNVQLRNDQQNFQPTLEVVRNSATDLTIRTSNQGCSITLTATGKVDPTATVNGPDQVRALMAVDDGLLATQQGFVVPVVFNFIVQPQGGSGTCGTSTCTALPDSLVTDSTLCASASPND